MVDIDIQMSITSVPFEAHYKCGPIPFALTRVQVYDMFGDANIDGFFSGRINGMEFIMSESPPIEVYSYELYNLIKIRMLLIQFIRLHLNREWYQKTMHVLPHVLNHHVAMHGVLPYVEYPFEYHHITAEDVFVFIDTYYHTRSSGVLGYSERHMHFVPIRGNIFTPELYTKNTSILWCDTRSNGMVCFCYMTKLGFNSRFIYIPHIDEWIVWTTCPCNIHASVPHLTWELIDGALNDILNVPV